MSTDVSILNLPGPTPLPMQDYAIPSSEERKVMVSSLPFYSPPEFAITPASSVEYRLKRIDGPPESRGWNVDRRQGQTFISFGREPAVDWEIPHESVSRKHAILQFGNGSDGPGWYLFDLGSQHGTFIDDEKIEPKSYVYLESGAQVRIGYAKKYIFTLVSSASEIDPTAEIQKVTYEPPSWKLPVPEELNYQLEIINNGSIERFITLKNVMKDNCYATIGKPDMASIIDKHPSVSRLHAVLQFGLLGKKYGWFLYDNKSSHGSKLNRAKLPPKYYAKLPIGGSFSLGASKQLYCLTGSHEDEEEFAKKAFAKIASTTKSEENEGKESAAEVKAFTADPIGWLTGYFETEGLSVDFSFTPGVGQHTTCSIDLRQVLQGTEDTVVKGEGRGRDEAKKNAALAACQKINDQSNGYQKPDFRTKRQEYEENDFYSSEEDEFFDRTGQLDERRRKRKQRYNEPDAANKVLTHDELVNQLKEAETTLENVKRLQEQISEEARTTKSLSAKFMLSSSRQKLLIAQTEVRRLSALVEATKPANIDEAFEKSKKIPTASIPVNNSKEIINEKEENQKPISQTSTSIPMSGDAESIEASTSVEEVIEDVKGKRTIEKDDRKKRTGFGLIHRKDLQELKNEALSAKKRKIMKFEDEEFEDKNDDRDSKTEIQAEPEDNAIWLPPSGQTGDGICSLNAKFAGKY